MYENRPPIIGGWFGGVYFMTFCPKMHQKRVQGVLKMENAMKWAKIEIYDSHQYSCSPEKVFPYELEPLGSLLSPIHGHTY